MATDSDQSSSAVEETAHFSKAAYIQRYVVIKYNGIECIKPSITLIRRYYTVGRVY